MGSAGVSDSLSDSGTKAGVFSCKNKENLKFSPKRRDDEERRGEERRLTCSRPLRCLGLVTRAAGAGGGAGCFLAQSSESEKRESSAGCGLASTSWTTSCTMSCCSRVSLWSTPSSAGSPARRAARPEDLQAVRLAERLPDRPDVEVAGGGRGLEGFFMSVALGLPRGPAMAPSFCKTTNAVRGAAQQTHTPITTCLQLFLTKSLHIENLSILLKKLVYQPIFVFNIFENFAIL